MDNILALLFLVFVGVVTYQVAKKSCLLSVVVFFVMFVGGGLIFFQAIGDPIFGEAQPSLYYLDTKDNDNMPFYIYYRGNDIDCYNCQYNINDNPFENLLDGDYKNDWEWKTLVCNKKCHVAYGLNKSPDIRIAGHNGFIFEWYK